MIYSPLLEMLIDDNLFFKFKLFDKIEELELTVWGYEIVKRNNCLNLADLVMLDYGSPNLNRRYIHPYKLNVAKMEMQHIFKHILFKENFIHDKRYSREYFNKDIVKALLDIKINKIIKEVVEFYSCCSNEEQIIYKITRNENKYLFFWINHFSSEKFYNKEIANKLVEFALKICKTPDNFNSIAVSVGLHLKDKISAKKIFEKSLSKVKLPGEFMHIKNCMNIVFGDWKEITEEWLQKTKDKENIYNLTVAIAAQKDISAKELARKYLPQIIKELDDTEKLVELAKIIGSFFGYYDYYEYWDGLNDVEWSKTVFQLALDKAKNNKEIILVIEYMAHKNMLNKEFLEEVKQSDKDNKLIKDDIIKKVADILNNKE